MSEAIKQEEKSRKEDFDQDNTFTKYFDKQFKMEMTWFNRIN